MAKTKVLGILGAPYCGSTVLDMVLSTHPDVQGAGELNYIANRWWNGANAASRVGCVECHAADRPCPVIPHGPVPVSQLHRSVARNAGVSWVVDGSYIRHAHDGNPAWAPGAAATPRGDGIARQWCDTYERILAFCASRPHIVVRYERFAGDPAAELARVAELMELSGFDHRTYREAQHHGVSGNWRARHEKNPVALPASLAVGVPPLSPLAWRQMSETWERVTG
jgi:hypothetical protein